MTVNSNEKGMHLPHGLTWLCELPFFLHTVFIFCQIRKLLYLHNFTINLSTYFSVVILEKQPSKIWFWQASRPINPTFTPVQSGGPTGVWLHLSTVVFAWWLESKIKWQRELSPFTEKVLINVWGNELSSVLIVLHSATENEEVFLKYQSFKSVYFWFRLDAPAVSRSQGKSLIGPRLGLIHIIQYSLIFFYICYFKVKINFIWFVGTPIL